MEGDTVAASGQFRRFPTEGRARLTHPPIRESSALNPRRPTRPATPALLLAAVLLLGSACASTGGAPVTQGTQVAAAGDAPVPVAEKPRTDSRTFRIGIWEFDLLALDLEPRGTTFRMLDFRIFKALEVGGGSDYHSFSVVSIPHILDVLTTRHEGPTYEHRLADLQALALAFLRLTKESERKYDTHLLKIPVAGSLYGREVDGATDNQTFLYVFGWDHER
jgi:hypothetical protein